MQKLTLWLIAFSQPYKGRTAVRSLPGRPWRRSSRPWRGPPGGPTPTSLGAPKGCWRRPRCRWRSPSPRASSPLRCETQRNGKPSGHERTMEKARGEVKRFRSLELSYTFLRRVLGEEWKRVQKRGFVSVASLPSPRSLQWVKKRSRNTYARWRKLEGQISLKESLTSDARADRCERLQLLSSHAIGKPWDSV